MSPDTPTVPGQRRSGIANLSVRAKVLGALLVAALVALAVGVTGLSALSRASDSAQHIYARNVANVGQVGQIKVFQALARVDIASQFIAPDEAAKKKAADAFNTDVQSFEQALAGYRDNDPAGDPAVITALQTKWQTYAQIVRDKQLPAGQRNDIEAWQQTRDDEVTPLRKLIDKDIEALGVAENVAAAATAASARSSYRSSRISSIVILCVGLLIALVLGLLVVRTIVRSLHQVKGVCEGLADGDLTRTSALTSGDEPGQMGRALDTAMHRLRSTVSSIDVSASSLATAAERMAATTTRIGASAQETSAQAQTVSAAAEQVSRSVETVSAGSEQMGASIREISQNAAEAARVAAEAVTITGTTSATMNKLGDSSSEIGNVIKVITSIAEQTNLLALNATIEAARAGDAGKGFAVVASEVKDLAQETARATEDISQRVEAIQTDTNGAVTAIEEISRVIVRISEFQTTIASAVEEQTATTAEMNRSVAEAATGAGAIAQSITSVAESARITSQGVADSQKETAELFQMSTNLNDLIAKFRH